MNRKIAAIIQIGFIVLVVGFGTCQLYLGNFEASISTMPFLVVYYLFVTVRQKRISGQEGQDRKDDTEQPR